MAENSSYREAYLSRNIQRFQKSPLKRDINERYKNIVYNFKLAEKNLKSLESIVKILPNKNVSLKYVYLS